MSATIVESIVTALVGALNTGRPVAVPTIERDRWVDVDTLAMPCIALTGWEDEPRQNQNEDRILDQRTLMLHFEIYASGTPAMPTGTQLQGAEIVLPSIPPSQAVDAMWAWLVKQCGPVERGTALAALGASRVTCEKRMAIVGKGNYVRCLVVLAVSYQNLVNDATRAK